MNHLFQKFPKNTSYILKYLSHLSHQNGNVLVFSLIHSCYFSPKTTVCTWHLVLLNLYTRAMSNAKIFTAIKLTLPPTDDNTTRVLFERVLTSLDKEQSWPIWSEFLSFESNVGDLASLMKVEKRRFNAFESVSFVGIWAVQYLPTSHYIAVKLKQ